MGGVREQESILVGALQTALRGNAMDEEVLEDLVLGLKTRSLRVSVLIPLETKVNTG